MKLAETYKIEEEGYHPFFISDGWQVAQLNYLVELHLKNINKLEVHFQTDEVFLLLMGKAVLILAEILNEDPIFEVELMEPSIIYNVPKNRWHNIVMEKGSKVLIVEKSNTHLGDFEYQYLTEKKIEELKLMVNKVLI